MSIITLTDRISVSVRAKNNTEKSAQNKATGANIQRALGGSGLSDSDLEEIGNVNSIQDEHGNEWIKMEDIIAAGRKMKEKGAFNNKEIHEGLTDSVTGTVYNFTNVYTPPVVAYINPNNPNYKGSISLESGSCYVVFNNGLGAYVFSKESFSVWYHYGLAVNAVGDPASVTINDITYSFFAASLLPSSMSNVTKDSPGVCVETDDNGWGGSKYAAGYLFGPVHEESNSLIDWDAPNAEVERQIKNLHETWDVSDHPGAVTGNGTYVLAGPIEFNDGD